MEIDGNIMETKLTKLNNWKLCHSRKVVNSSFVLSGELEGKAPVGQVDSTEFQVIE